MKKLVFIGLFTGLVFSVAAQQPDVKVNNPYKDRSYIPDGDEAADSPTNADSDQGKIEAVIYGLFEAMLSSDANRVRSFFSIDAKLMATEKQKLTVIGIEDFAKNIGSAAKGSLDERVTSMEVRIDDHMASAWVGYDFYYRDEFSHCGIDAIQLHNGSAGWKIIQIADTRRKECALGDEQKITQLLDDWHAAATDADLNRYFKYISQDGYFLGTDASENWNKEAFYQFSKPYFDKGRAWDFKASDRRIFFSQNSDIAWFNELLDTWMGTCRGSGVMVKNEVGNWEIKQYNLAILVPNELVQDYVKLQQESGN
ncbi:MAG: nuclear transport factor 2 family protein [Saprospiraceae bacterium]|nr:nuclear transport factor 2 family protein [Saprospiraceae bacterium]